jgi:Arc/MetJ-type ribon-helix-helix transcriptional regulator
VRDGFFCFSSEMREKIAMPCDKCGAPDEQDLSAESRGLMLKSEAARAAGRSSTWITSRIAARELEIREFANRSYVVRASLERLLRVEGGANSVNARIERLIDSNQLEAAQALHRQAYPQAWDGSGLMPSGNTAATPTDLPDPFTKVIVRNLNAKGK